VVAVAGTLLICAEEASSSLLSMLSLPDGESWFSPRILFSRAGVRPYLWRRSQTFPHKARTRCSPASRLLPSSGEANGRHSPVDSFGTCRITISCQDRFLLQISYHPGAVIVRDARERCLHLSRRQRMIRHGAKAARLVDVDFAAVLREGYAD
jgi:hypothetical protein